MTDQFPNFWHWLRVNPVAMASGIVLLFFTLLTLLVFPLTYFSVRDQLVDQSIPMKKGPDGKEERSPPGYWDCVYFSVVSATTTGFGDIYPTGVARIVVCVQMLFNVFILSIGLPLAIRFVEEKIDGLESSVDGENEA